MSVHIHSHDDGSRLTIAGEMTIYTVTDLRDSFQDLFSRHDQLEVDLAEVEEIDTAGLQWMLAAKKAPGKQVRFVNHSPAVLARIELANLARALGDPLVMPPASAPSL